MNTKTNFLSLCHMLLFLSLHCLSSEVTPHRFLQLVPKKNVEINGNDITSIALSSDESIYAITKADGTLFWGSPNQQNIHGPIQFVYKRAFEQEKLVDFKPEKTDIKIVNNRYIFCMHRKERIELITVAWDLQKNKCFYLPTVFNEEFHQKRIISHSGTMAILLNSSDFILYTKKIPKKVYPSKYFSYRPLLSNRFQGADWNNTDQLVSVYNNYKFTPIHHKYNKLFIVPANEKEQSDRPYYIPGIIKLATNNEWIHATKWTPDDSLLVVLSCCNIGIWDKHGNQITQIPLATFLPQQRCIHDNENPQRIIRGPIAIAFSKDNRQCYIEQAHQQYIIMLNMQSYDASLVALHDAQSGDFSAENTHVLLSPDGSLLMTFDKEQHKLSIHDTTTGSCLYDAVQNNCTRVEFDHQGNQLFLFNNNGFTIYQLFSYLGSSIKINVPTQS